MQHERQESGGNIIGGRAQVSFSNKYDSVDHVLMLTDLNAWLAIPLVTHRGPAASKPQTRSEISFPRLQTRGPRKPNKSQTGVHKVKTRQELLSSLRPERLRELKRMFLFCDVGAKGSWTR